MTQKAERILEPKLIPISLWDKGSSTLFIPPILSDAYIHLIDKYNFRLLRSVSDKGDGPVGGLTQEETNKHFAQSFDGSSARSLLSLLDPKEEAGSTSNTLLKCLAGGHISFTDVPCGAGAAAYTFLSAIAHLRETNVLPRTPLSVELIGGELSIFARNHAIEFFDLIKDQLEEQAIFVNTEFVDWDVTDRLSTTDLITKCVQQSANKSYKLLVVANFNGFLEKDRKRKDAEPQLEELFRYASGVNSFAIWIEPDMNRATASGGLFSRLKNLFSGVWKKIGRTDLDMDGPMYTSNALFQLPLEPAKNRKVSLAVMPLILDRNI